MLNDEFLEKVKRFYPIIIDKRLSESGEVVAGQVIARFLLLKNICFSTEN